MINIRAFNPEDCGEVIRLWEKIFPDSPAHNDPLRDIQNKMKVQPELFLVALVDFQLVGTSMAGFDGHRGWVYYLAVDPGFRRQGIGTALMKKAEESLVEAGCPKLNIQIRADNAAVRAFYEKLGYQFEDRISMGKHLAAGQ